MKTTILFVVCVALVCIANAESQDKPNQESQTKECALSKKKLVKNLNFI